VSLYHPNEHDRDVRRDTSREFNLLAKHLRDAFAEQLVLQGLPPGTPYGQHQVHLDVLLDEPPRVRVRPTPQVPGLDALATDAVVALGIEPEDTVEEQGRTSQPVILTVDRSTSAPVAPLPEPVASIWNEVLETGVYLPRGRHLVGLVQSARGIKLTPDRRVNPAVVRLLESALRDAGVLDTSDRVPVDPMIRVDLQRPLPTKPPRSLEELADIGVDWSQLE